MSFMMGMLPPGVQQLMDSLPEPDTLEYVGDRLVQSHDEQEAQVGKFLEMLGQTMKQNGLGQQVKEPTEPLKVRCPKCELEFTIDNPTQYRRNVEEGQLYACANGHEVQVLGSGRLGSLTPDEQLTFDNEPNVMVIYPKDYEPSNDNPSD